MSISVNDANDRYIGDGTTTSFAYNFKVLDQSQILVLVDGIPMTLGSHYSVSGVGNASGGITFFVPPIALAVITILRNQPIEQMTAYINNEAYNPLKLAGDLDKSTMINQMQEEEISRAPKFAKQSIYANKVFPDPVALNFIRWNAGLELENADPVSMGSFPVAVFPLNSIYGGTGSATRTVNVREYGALGNDLHDDTAAIQAAIVSITNRGGGIIYFDKGIFRISSTLTISGHNVVLCGIGPGEIRQIQTQVHTSGTVLKWIGGAGTMLQMQPFSNASGHRLAGCGIYNIFFDGGELAVIGLDLKSLNLCRFVNLAFHGILTSAIDTNVIATLAAPRDFQHCHFENIWIDADNQTALTATGMRLNGDATANTSFNTLLNLTVTYKNGVGIDVINADNNDFLAVHEMTTGTGKGVILRASAVSSAFTSRNNYFFDLETHLGGIVVEANTYIPVNNVIYGYSTANGAPFPITGIPTIYPSQGTGLWYEADAYTNKFRHFVPICRARATANLSTTNGVNITVPLAGEDFDTGTMHDTVTNNSRMTATLSGYYRINAGVIWATNSTGERYVSLTRNGVNIEGAAVRVLATTLSEMTVSTMMLLANNDYIEIVVGQSSGGALNLTNAVLCMEYIGEN